MPSIQAICNDLCSCMCSNSGEVSPQPYSRRREHVNLPARDPLQPQQNAKPLRSPEPGWLQDQQAQRDDPSPGESGPPTVKLVPKTRPQDPASRQALGKPAVHKDEEDDKLPPTPTPQAKQRPRDQTKVRPIRRLDSQMYRSDDPRIVLPAEQAEATLGASDHADCSEESRPA